MLTALLMLAAEEHGETSKTPFYVAAGVLAVWAVLVSVAGMTRSDFPGSAVAARGVMAITAVLVAVAMATSVITG